MSCILLAMLLGFLCLGSAAERDNESYTARRAAAVISWVRSLRADCEGSTNKVVSLAYRLPTETRAMPIMCTFQCK